MSEWKTVRLGDVCSLIARGIAPKYVDEGGLLVLNQKCVRDHVVAYRLGRRHDIAAKRVSSERLVRTGDVLVNSTGTGTLGRVAQVRSEPQEPATVDTHVTIVRPAPGEFHPGFFGYALVLLEDELARSGEGASGQTELSRSTIAKLVISYPTDLEEQRQIAALLDEAFAAIAAATAHAEKNLANARDIFDAQREFILAGDGWPEARLADLCSIKHGFAFKSEHFADAGEYALLTPGNFLEAGGYRDRGPKQKYYEGPIPAGFVLEAGALLVAMTEQAAGLLGSPVIVPSESIFLHNQRLGLVEPKSQIAWDNGYFFHVFNTRGVRDELHRTGTGVKVRHTSPEKIGRLVVAMPRSLVEQRTIAQRLDRLADEADALISVQRRKLAFLQELRQSLLHRAFSGALNARDPIPA